MASASIKAKDLEELLFAAHMFSALESGGVDNWNWYSKSIRDYINNYVAENELDYGVEYKYDMDDIVRHDMAVNYGII